MIFDVTEIDNRFNAPVLHRAETDSTMEDARTLAAEGYPSGSVIFADFQRSGRGRIEGRTWQSAPAENLLCTVLLRSKAPTGFTLRAGLAVARTFDAFLPAGVRTQIKWPNDVMIDGKKIAGILCENDGATLYAGTGLNIGQKAFPPGIADTATSLALVLASHAESGTFPVPPITAVLSLYLEKLEEALELDSWQSAVSEKLLYRGERISFLAGDPGRREIIYGSVEGIGEAGELLLTSESPCGSFKPDSAGHIHLWSGEIRNPNDR